MKIKINVQSAVYDAGLLKINLDAGNYGKANVKSVFDALLPFANLASQEAVDFFIISAAVYGIDRFIVRRPNSIDGWSRELEVVFPVKNPDNWHPIKEELSSVLSFLTGDYWSVDFSSSTLELPVAELDESCKVGFAQVNLFSGGLDSLIGALKFLEENQDKRLIVVSHYDSQMKGPKTDQMDLLEDLNSSYGDRIVSVPSVKVELDKPGQKETTFRSRSILFIGMAGIVADALKLDIKVPENGSVPLNYPLSVSRRTACSTRTTHPKVLDIVGKIWESLGIKSDVSNPFEFYTKGEMVLMTTGYVEINSILTRSNSCCNPPFFRTAFSGENSNIQSYLSIDILSTRRVEEILM